MALLTPADVHNVAFNMPPIGKRGYKEDEVDQFLDLVEDTLAEMQEENDELRRQVEELQAGGATAASGDSVDSAAIRREVEAELADSHEAELASLREKLAQAESERDAARREAQDAKRQSSAKPAVEPTAAGEEVATADTHVQAAKVLGLAQEMADRLTADAQAESDSLLTKARESAERQVNEAETEARATLEKARSEAKTLVDDAERKSAATLADADKQATTQVRQAEEKAAALQADAERKHSEIMATVKQQQSALENRIAELRTFEREYRARLKNLLQSQLDDLESRESSAPEQR